jgi:putative endonuclease
MSSDYFYVYIVTNNKKEVLYTGMTNSLRRRLFEHQNEPTGFARQYNCCHLIYFEKFQSASEAIYREKQIKKFRREKKEELINAFNPLWEFKDHLFLTPTR